MVHGPKGKRPKALILTEELFLLAMDSLGHTLCPRSDRGAMADYIIAEPKANGLSGLILLSLKFCDFYAFEFERIRRRSRPDFPILYIENDLSVENDEQNRTRIEAFMEQIRSYTGAGRTSAGRKARGAQGVFAIGLDIGSATTKGVLMKEGREITASFIRPTSINMQDGAQQTLEDLLAQAKLTMDDIRAIIFTGYGRTAFPDATQITEITCHALGVHFLRGEGATIIDVGGQDSKAIRIDEQGNVLRFAMNDKCAAGTGRFLESMVKRMEISFDAFSTLSLDAALATPISACVRLRRIGGRLHHGPGHPHRPHRTGAERRRGRTGLRPFEEDPRGTSFRPDRRPLIECRLHPGTGGCFGRPGYRLQRIPTRRRYRRGRHGVIGPRRAGRKGILTMSTTGHHLHRLIYRAMMGKGRHLPPASAFRMTRLWTGLTSFHKVPSIRLLEREYLSYFIEGLTPGKGVWTSIFVPTELLYAFDLAPLCLEGLSALTAGMGIAHDFLGRHGPIVPNTMCNFHRLAIDLAKSGLLPGPDSFWPRRPFATGT